MKNMSIIIPVYNTEAYLQSCLDSICEQNLADMQVICVDDGSSDSSWQILEQYSNKYRFVEVFKNSENMGLAYTRNVGLKHACGKYIMYVDSDDYLASDSLRSLYEQMQRSNLDVLFFDVQEFEDENNMLNDKRIRKNHYAVMQGLELMALLVKNAEMFGSVCGTVYRRRYLEEQKVEFIDGILHEDIAYTFAATLNAERACAVNQVVYFYRQRKESILHNPDYKRLLHGLTVTYASMLMTWNDFLYRQSRRGDADVYIMKYMDSVVHMMRSRYYHASEHGSVDMVTGNFFDNFSFNVEKVLQTYFEAEDIRRIKKAENVLVYGAGNIAREVIAALMEFGIKIQGVYVTDISQSERLIYDIPIEAYRNISFSERKQCMIIAVSKDRQREIANLLQKHGFKGEIVWQRYQ